MGKFVTIANPENPIVVIAPLTQMVPGVQPLTHQQAFPISNQFAVSNPEDYFPSILPQIKEKIVEVIKEVQVEKIVYVDKIVEKEIPIIVFKDRYIDVIKEVIVEKPVIQIVTEFKEKIIEIPRIVVRKQAPDWCWIVMVALAASLAMSLLLK